MRLTLREKTHFEVKNKERETTREHGGVDCRGKFIPERGINGCEGYQLSHKDHDVGPKVHVHVGHSQSDSFIHSF